MKSTNSLSGLALCAAICAGMCAAPPSASAATVTAGQTLLFNVDIGAFAPTLQEVFFRPNLAGFDNLLDSGVWSFFAEADAQGTAAGTASAGLTQQSLTGAGFLDGIFSVVLQMTGGEIDIEPEVFGRVSIGNGEFAFTPSVSVSGVLVNPPVEPPAGVPEPGSLLLALMAAGSALATGRRRKA
jgi:hypothetical protein